MHAAGKQLTVTLPAPLKSQDRVDEGAYNWAEIGKEPHAELLDWHRRLIALRREHPALTDGRRNRVRCRYDEERRWFVLHRNGIAVVCNLAGRRQAVPIDGAPAGVVLSSAPGFVYRHAEIEIEPESVAIVTFVHRGDEPPLSAP